MKMTIEEQHKELCEWLNPHLTLPKFKDKCGVLIRPCFKCGSKKLEVWDCGYSSFNPGGVKCLSCKYEFEISHVNDSKDSARAWNRHFKSELPPLTLDLIREARQKLNEQQRFQFLNFLREELRSLPEYVLTEPRACYANMWLYVDATIEQQLKPILRTVGRRRE